MTIREEELTGKVRTHIIQIENPRFAACSETVNAFFSMCDAAKKKGIEIFPFSSFRDFKTQMRIWNKKFKGEKPLFDINGNVRNYSNLNENEIIDYILNWSALPGASRHHWGTEIDVIDVANMPEKYRVKLLPEEINEGGLFYKLHNWLDKNITKFGFFRPYQKYTGGMYPEPWHLSYAPLSIHYMENMSFDLVKRTIENSNILGKELVLKRLPDIFEKHIKNINNI